jgi:hypothetical protein
MDLIDKHIKEQEAVIEDVSVKAEKGCNADEEGFRAITREAEEKIAILTAIRDEVERTMEPRTPESNAEYEKLMRLGTSKERGWVGRWVNSYSAARNRVRFLEEKVEAYDKQWEWAWYNDEDGTIVHDVKSPTQAKELIGMLIYNNLHLQAELRREKKKNRTEKELS